MLLPSLLPIALLAGSSVAKPIGRVHLSSLLSSDSSSFQLTDSSTDHDPIAVGNVDKRALQSPLVTAVLVTQTLTNIITVTIPVPTDTEVTTASTIDETLTSVTTATVPGPTDAGIRTTSTADGTLTSVTTASVPPPTNNDIRTASTGGETLTSVATASVPLPSDATNTDIRTASTIGETLTSVTTASVPLPTSNDITTASTTGEALTNVTTASVPLPSGEVPSPSGATSTSYDAGSPTDGMTTTTWPTAGPTESPSRFPFDTGLITTTVVSRSTSINTESPSRYPFDTGLITTTIVKSTGVGPDGQASPISTSSCLEARDLSAQEVMSPSGAAYAVASSCVPAAPPAAVPTQVGVVSGCSKWHVPVTGEYCITVAEQYGISVDVFMAWNPSVTAPTCPSMLAGYAYCVATCSTTSASSTTQTTGVSTLSSTVPTTTTPDGARTTDSTQSTSTLSTSDASTVSSSTATTSSETLASSASPSSYPSPTATPSGTAYKAYYGDGTTAAGWPAMDQWVPFEQMFESNRDTMKTSCAAWGVPNNSDDEISTMKSAILSTATSSGIDARFILAIIMQESSGCVRVISTQYGVYNPGLMQSHNGTGTCNTNAAALGLPGVAGDGTVQSPCPASEISQMIQDGTMGTATGDGLKQIMTKQGKNDDSRWYRTARIYNGGSIEASGMLEEGCCTRSYASDVANRLVGWVGNNRTFA